MRQYITLSKQAQYTYNTNNHDIHKIYIPLKGSCLLKNKQKQNEKKKTTSSDTQKIDESIISMIKTYIFVHNTSLNDDQHVETYYSIITRTIFQMNQWGKMENISDIIIELTRLIMNAYPLKLIKSINNLKKLLRDDKFTVMNIQVIFAEESTIYENLKKSTISLYNNNILCAIGTSSIITVFRNHKFRYFKIIKYDIYSLINVVETTTYHSFNIENILKYH